MKTILFFTTILSIMFFTYCEKPVYAQNTLPEVEAKIKELEQGKKQIEASINLMNDLKTKMESKNYYAINGFLYLFTKEEFEAYVTLRVLSGTINISGVTDFVKQTESFKQSYLQSLTEEIKNSERTLQKVKDDINYWYDQKIRLKETVDCVPNVEGTYIINGDPTGAMILRQKGKTVAGFYGKDKSNLVNMIDGELNCNVLEGTFYNTQYDVSGKFKYTFSKDGSSYAGQWWNNTGGATGTNSGTRESKDILVK